MNRIMRGGLVSDWYRLRWYAALVIGCAFSVSGLAMALSGEALGWIVLLFFLCCAAMAVHELWPQVIERHQPPEPAAVLSRYPGPVMLNVPKTRQIFFLVGGLVFGGCLAFLALLGDLNSIENLLLWLGVFVVAVASPIMLLAILRGSTLHLDADGLCIFQGLKRRTIPWSRTSEFGVADAGILSIIRQPIVVFDEDSTKDGVVGGFNRSLFGRSGGLPENYGMEAVHLARLLNAWRARALAR